MFFYFYSLRASSFGNERKKWSESECEGNGEELGEEEVGESVIIIYYRGKLFSINGKIHS